MHILRLFYYLRNGLMIENKSKDLPKEFVIYSFSSFYTHIYLPNLYILVSYIEMQNKLDNAVAVAAADGTTISRTQ